ncbi:hypothetical protein Tco_1419619 [Tanacetum coccineum]
METIHVTFDEMIEMACEQFSLGPGLHLMTTGTSSSVLSSHSPLELIGKWTKDHPLENVIGNPSRLVSTRKHLETDAMWCYFNVFLTSVDLNNFKEPMLESSWIDAMRRIKFMNFERQKLWKLGSSR